MFDKFRQSTFRKDEAPVDPKRRTLMFGAVAGAAAVGLGLTGKEERGNFVQSSNKEPLREIEDDLAGKEIEGVVERMKTDSGHFFAERDMFAEGYVSELQLMENPKQLKKLLDEHFDMSAIPDTTLRKEVMDNIYGLALVESRFDETRVSEAGAFGLMQLMPETWNKLSLPDEDPTNVIDQIKVAARLVVQSYVYISQQCQNELDVITINHFDGNQKAMMQYFFGPVLIGAYNSGMGNLEKIIKHFVKLYPTTKETTDMFDGVDIPTGYDVYFGMTKAAMFEEWRPSYKIHGSEYTTKVYGATYAMKGTA
ncbi:MAG: lytic transglycosylase domain-containing protein [Candidatus Paceibacteria bacterium]